MQFVLPLTTVSGLLLFNPSPSDTPEFPELEEFGIPSGNRHGAIH